ncbi:MAG: histidine--tRNA ligase [Flavobacteriaceae bacterium]|nr:histidine--tRNA ligase [Flavobacteriaceae bacterium]
MSISPLNPKGTRDFLPLELSKRNYIINILRRNFKNFGFSEIETPALEKSSTLLDKYGSEGDKLVFKILNSGDKVKKADILSLQSGDLNSFVRSVSEKGLKYDLTVPLARFVSQHQNEIIFPFKRFQIQNVWRADRPQHGRFQEFTQCDADVIGSNSIIQEIELIKMYDSIFNQLGFKDLVLKINHRGILKGLACHFGADKNIMKFISALDKIDKIGVDKVLEEIKLISSNFSEKQLKNILSEKEFDLTYLKKIFIKNSDSILAIDEIDQILNFFSSNNLVNDLKFDLRLARGLNYYTGTIIEVSSKTNTRIGSIGGGGRYDDLTSKFNLNNMSGVGISFGLDRIYLLLEESNLFPEYLDKSFEFMVANFGIDNLKFISPYIDEIRNKNREVLIYPDNVKLNKQFNYADKHNVSTVIIFGDNERKNGIVLLKNMLTGEQLNYQLNEFIEAVIKR